MAKDDPFGFSIPAKGGRENFQDFGFQAETFIKQPMPKSALPMLPNAGQPWPTAPRFVRGTHGTKETTKGSNQSK